MLAQLFGLAGKHVIVLGGGLGMGEATCRLLASLGCNVTVLDIVAERAEGVAAALREMGVKALPITADVLDDAALVGAIDRAEREIAPLDGLVSIVGMAHMGSATDIPMEIWDLDHRRNLRYIFLAAREVARRLIARGAPGSIACVASVDGLKASTNHAAYGAAKAGLVHMAKSLAGEWSRHGVRFNVVAPGAMITPRIKAGAPEQEREMMKLVPMQRRGGVDDIANALVFFLSDLSGYVTGQTLAVDGGFSVVGPVDYSRFATDTGVRGVDRA
ncbi:SDR family NAD(P)-dependent oxidoreductase [Novosphingobium bradum]|uniref:SDR family NAD(P)-dependent oxidoreductase n=1 Tax=Novosphingobium bradum TaxID=1737444 RepID=A0ABV7IUJ9_9SPHN